MKRGAGSRSINRRVLAALLAGVLLGVTLAMLLQATIARTATPLSPARALWQLLLLAFAGGLSGFALSTVAELQASNNDPEYKRHRRHPNRAATPPNNQG
ncbi:MAG: hypothetical protein VKI39_02905 [Synechococcus sp.]|nr:hypothetical protein [Synechococcus sp.]